MSIHRVFAANLRDHCIERGSIAAVCKGARVNRQQFNRYLSSSALPNAATMARICSFLGIREAELFRERAVNSNALKPTQLETPQVVEPLIHEFAAALGLSMDVLGFLKATNVSGIPEGYYYCYFPAQNLENYIMRTLIRVQRVGSRLVFKRVTLLRSRDAGRRLLAVTKHIGLVISTLSGSYFLAGSTMRHREISLLVMENVDPAGGNVRRGLGLVTGYSGPMACQICLEGFSPNPQQPRKMFEALGLVQLNDQSLNPIVKALYLGPQNSRSGQISLPGVESALLGRNLDTQA